MGAGASGEKEVVKLSPLPLLREAERLTTRGYDVQAKKIYLKALTATIEHSGPDSIETARVYAQIASMFIKFRNFKDALDYLLKAQQIFDALKDQYVTVERELVVRGKTITKKLHVSLVTQEEYRLLLSNLAFVQYSLAQMKPRTAQILRV